MSVWLDLIGSFVIGSLLALTVMRMNSDITVQSYESAMVYMAQNGAATLAEIVEEDFQKIGYAVSDTAIALADTSQIQFLADMGADGTIDTLHYYLSSKALASITLNPSDRLVYRKLNGDSPLALQTGITNFALSYFNASGDSMALPVVPGDIRQIRVDITVESSEAYYTTTQDTFYARAFMQLRIRPKNLEP